MANMVGDHRPSSTLQTTLDTRRPWFDVGTAEEVLERVGATRRGPTRDEFKRQAEGLVCVRLGWELFAMSREEFLDVIKNVTRPTDAANYTQRKDRALQFPGETAKET